MDMKFKLREEPGSTIEDCLPTINSVQTRCIVKGEAQKSPLFRRFSGGL